MLTLALTGAAILVLLCVVGVLESLYDESVADAEDWEQLYLGPKRRKALEKFERKFGQHHEKQNL